MPTARQGRIAVVFESDVTETQKKAVLRSKGLQAEGSLSDSTVFVTLPKGKELPFAEALSLLPGVETAIPNPKPDLILVN